MAFRRFCRCLFPGRRTWKFFLYTLPLTFWPLLTGSIEGVLFEVFMQRHQKEIQQRFSFEQEMDAWSDTWSVPGAHGIHEVTVEPFHLVPLRNTKWWQQLNLWKPPTDYDASAHFHRWAALEGLWAEDDVVSGRPLSRWVYIATWGFGLYDPWDIAFDQLLQYHYVHPPAQNATISYIDPAKASFLTKVWAVKAPAMVHFQVETSGMDSDGQQHSPRLSRRGLPMYPVTVQVAELGLKTFKPGVFPSYFEQLLFLTSGEHDPQELFEWESFFQHMMRYGDWYDELIKRYTVLDVIEKVDDWIEEQLPTLHEVLSVLGLLVFAAAFALASLPRIIYWSVLNPMWKRFAGYPQPSEDAVANLFREASDDEKMMRHPLLGGAVAAFFENITQILQAQQNASISEAAASAVTSSATK